MCNVDHIAIYCYRLSMLRMILQGVVTHIEFVTGIKMESRDQHGNCTESSGQGMLQRGDQAACRRVRLSKTNIW